MLFIPGRRQSLIATSQARLRYGLIITLTTQCMCYIVNVQAGVIFSLYFLVTKDVRDFR